MEIEKSLAVFPMFSGLEKAELAELAKMAMRINFAKGQNIFVEGHEITGFYLLEWGRVKVYKVSPEGKEYIIHIIEPGLSFAEACIFFEHQKCPASADALEDSRTIFLHKDGFLAAVRRSPSLGMRMLGSMAEWLRLMSEQVGSLSLNTVEGRLVKHLVTLAVGRNVSLDDGVTITLDMGKSVLAARLGTVPETLSRTLKKLENKSIIRVERGNITILNARRLLEVLD